MRYIIMHANIISGAERHARVLIPHGDHKKYTRVLWQNIAEFKVIQILYHGRWMILLVMRICRLVTSHLYWLAKKSFYYNGAKVFNRLSRSLP